MTNNPLVDAVMFDWTRIHRQAAAFANAMVPNYELNTPEHDAWLVAYDASVSHALRTVLKQGSR